MSDSEDSDNFDPKSFQSVHEEIERYKKNPQTSGMFVSGWDDADQDVDMVKNPKESPKEHILFAAENGDLDTVKQLVASNINLIHVQDSDGYTPLHRAAYSNHVSIIAYLLSVGARVNTKTELGWTALHSACNWNNYLAVARLLAGGADPLALSDGEQTPLHLAAAISHSKSTLLVLLFREDTVDIVQRKNNSGETPEELARGHGIYAPLFEMALPAVSFIHSVAFTSNPYVRKGILSDRQGQK